MWLLSNRGGFCRGALSPLLDSKILCSINPDWLRPMSFTYSLAIYANSAMRDPGREPPVTYSIRLKWPLAMSRRARLVLVWVWPGSSMTWSKSTNKAQTGIPARSLVGGKGN